MSSETIFMVAKISGAIGAIIVIISGVVAYFANERMGNEPKIHVNSIKIYKIVSSEEEEVPRNSKLGFLLDLTSTNKLLVIKGLNQKISRIEIVPSTQGHGLISNLKILNENPKLVSTYILNPGARTTVAFELPVEFDEMAKMGGINVNLQGDWFLVVGTENVTNQNAHNVLVDLSGVVIEKGNVSEEKWRQKFVPIDDDLGVKYRH